MGAVISKRLRRLVLLAGAALGCSSGPAAAQTSTWVGTDPNWSLSTNWSPTGVPNGAGVVVRLNGSGANTVTVNGAFTVGRVTIDATTAFTQSVGGVFTPGWGLTLDNGASAGVIEVVANTNGSGNGSVGTQVTIAGDNTLNLLAPGNTTLSFLVAPITGSGAAVNVNPSGQTGTVQFNAANTYGGAGSVTTVGGGRLVAVDGVGLPTNTALVLNGAVWETSGIVTRALGTGDGQLQVTGAAAGFSGSDGVTARLQLGGGTGTVTWGGPAFNPGSLILGSSTGGVVLENGLDLNGATRTVRSDGVVFPAAPGGTISGVISNSSGTAAGLTKDGTGILTLSAANTYNGPTTVSNGVLRANPGQGLPSGSNLTLAGGAFESIGDATLSRAIGTAAGQVQWTGSGGALSAKGGTLIVSLNPGNSAPLVWGSPGFVAAGNSLNFGSAAFDGAVEFRNDLDLAGGTRTVAATVPTTGPVGLVRLTGVVSNGSFTASSPSGGTIELSGANTYAGQTSVAGGALRATDGVGLPSGSNLLLSGGVLEGIGPTTFTRSLGTGPGQVQIGFAGGFSASGGPMTVRLNNGTATLAWSSLGGGADPFRLQFGSRTSDDLTDFQNGLNLGGAARFFQVDDNPLTAADRTRLSGVITNGGVTKTSLSGTLELTGANTYTQATTVQGGALRAVNGVGLPAASNLVLAGGTLEGIGATTFTRSLGTGAGQVQFTGNGGFSASGGVTTVQLNNGTAAVTWGTGNFVPSASALAFGSATADNVADLQNDLNLNGGNRQVFAFGNVGYAGPVGRLSGVISNGGLTLNSTSMSNPGTLELTGANTYAGGTTVNAGRLLVNNPTGSGTGTGAVTVGTQFAVLPATLGGGGTIAPAAGNSVTFNNGSRVEPGFGADHSLRIATTGGGTISIGTQFAPAGSVTWAVRVTAAGTGGVAANSGLSTVGSAPDPANHTFLDLSGGGVANSVYIDSRTIFEVDGTGAGFTPLQRYSYVIGRAGSAAEIQFGPLNFTDQSRFVAIGFQASDFSVTSDGTGAIYLNFTPVPDPTGGLAVAAAGLAVGVVRRRWKAC